MKALIAMLILIPLIVPAQSPQVQDDPRFSAASLKPVAPQPPPIPAPPGEEIISERIVSTAPGALVNTGRIHRTFTLREFLANAYDVKEYQIEGPPWMATERFTLDAVMPPETTRERRLQMLQSLLTERFLLTIHHEQKDRPMYSLVLAKSGLKVKESPELVTNVRTTATGGSTRVSAQATTMQDLADHLTRQLDRPVKDETGRTERYDFVLAFSSEGQDLPDIFGAVQSQLGLKLEAKKAPVDLIVIDHIERTPSGN